MWGSEGWGLVALGGFMAFCANVLYMWGGTEGFGDYAKLWRRLGAAFLLASAVNFIAIAIQSWAWQYLIFYPALFAGFSNGYGGDSTIIKVIRRSLYALGVSAACIAGLYATGFTGMGYLLLGLSVLTGLTSIVLGVVNPFKSARVEEFLICQVLTLYIPFWPYVGGN